MVQSGWTQARIWKGPTGTPCQWYGQAGLSL